MLASLQKVSFGPSSWTLLLLLLASFVPLIEQWHETGVFPTSEAWITAALGAALALIRTVQAIAADRAGDDNPTDQATITPHG